MNVGCPETIPDQLRGLRVLLVDHDPQSLKYMTSVLEAQFYLVSSTRIASVGLAMVLELGIYDVVLAETDMIDGNYLTFLGQITFQRPNVTVILMTSSTENKTIANEALANGAACFLWKPLRAKDLWSVWQHVFRKRTANRLKNVENNLARKSYEREGIIASTQLGQGNYLIGENNIQQVDFERDGKKSDTENKLNKKSCGVRKQKQIKEGKKRCLSSRITWTPELNDKFVRAMAASGDKQAHPKALLRIMDVPELTPRHVSSKLQKYKTRVREVNENIMIDHDHTTKLGSEIPSSSTRPWLPTNSPYNFSPSTAPCINSGGGGGWYLTLERIKDYMEKSNFSSRPPPTSCNNYRQPLVNDQPGSPFEFEDFLNPISPNLDMIMGSGNVDRFHIGFPGLREEANFQAQSDSHINNSSSSFTRSSFINGDANGSSMMNAVAGVVDTPSSGEQSSITNLEMITKLLESEDDSQDLSVINGEAVDSYSKWLVEV